MFNYKKSAHRSEREYNRANILLLLDKGKMDSEIEDFLEVDRTTIWRTKQKYINEGLEHALQEKERSGQPVKYGAKQKADVIATACSRPPEGRARWTLELLSDILKEKEGLSTINSETIRLILKKTNVNLEGRL
ncbi:MAG: helix-turn-helix domain-containing protein [Bacteroidota bacterium]